MSIVDCLQLPRSSEAALARAVQRTVDLPVFSWGALLDYAYGVVAHRDYYGHV